MTRRRGHYHDAAPPEDAAMSETDGGYLTRREFDQFARSTRQELHGITANIDGLRADLKGVGRVPGQVVVAAGALALAVSGAAAALVSLAVMARVDPVIERINAVEKATLEQKADLAALEDRRTREAELRAAPVLQRVAALEAARERMDDRVRAMEANRYTAMEGAKQDERLQALEVSVAKLQERAKP